MHANKYKHVHTHMCNAYYQLKRRGKNTSGHYFTLEIHSILKWTDNIFSFYRIIQSVYQVSGFKKTTGLLNRTY